MDELEDIIRDAKCETRAEALIAVVHVVALQNGYNGVNEDPNSDGKKLHSSWNKDKASYALTYHRSSSESPLSLHIEPSETEISIKSKDVRGNTIASHTLSIDSYVNKDASELTDANKIFKIAVMNLGKTLESSIFFPREGKPTRKEEQRHHEEEFRGRQEYNGSTPDGSNDPSSSGPFDPAPQAGRGTSGPRNPDAGRIGADDLGPPGLNVGEPHRGMLFDPRNPPGSGDAHPAFGDYPGPRPPPGAIVPGARYDPIGPFGGMHGGFGGAGQMGEPPGRGPQFGDIYGPDFDELPPPGSLGGLRQPGGPGRMGGFPGGPGMSGGPRGGFGAPRGGFGAPRGGFGGPHGGFGGPHGGFGGDGGCI